MGNGNGNDQFNLPRATTSGQVSAVADEPARATQDARCDKLVVDRRKCCQL